MPVTIGHEQIIQDVPILGADVASISPLVLIHSGATSKQTFTDPEAAAAALAASSSLVAMTDAFFGEGGGQVTVVPLTGTAPNYTLTTALNLVGNDLAGGQVAAPEVVTSTLQAQLSAWAWDTNRVYLADGADGATITVLNGLGDAIRASAGDRAAAGESDTLIIPGRAGGPTREVPASVVTAGMIARTDRETGNPNLAVAGVRGQTRYAIGIKAERTTADRNSLADHGFNTYRRMRNGAIRRYGHRTTADPAKHPQWWDLGGCRTVMAYRASAEVAREDSMFAQLDGDGTNLAALETRLAARLKELQDVGALFKKGTQPGYRVRCDLTTTTVADIAAGRAYARTWLRTSPFAERITEYLAKIPITLEV